MPVFDTMAEAVAQTGANTSCIFVPAAFAPDAMLEAADAGVELVICITEGVPALDMLRVYHALKARGVRLIGPNCPGATTVGEAKVGIIPGSIHRPGAVGLVSRSGTLTYEVVQAMTDAGMGQSTCVGIGGDPIVGTSFIDVLDMFNRDRQTEAIVMIGEIGGEEERAAAFVEREVRKPMATFIAGRTAPLAVAWDTPARSSPVVRARPRSKRQALEAAGVRWPIRRPTSRRCCATGSSLTGPLGGLPLVVQDRHRDGVFEAVRAARAGASGLRA